MRAIEIPTRPPRNDGLCSSFASSLFLAGLLLCAGAPASRASLVSHWRFDETTGITVHDVTGRNDGQLSGTGATFAAGGIQGGAVQLDRTQNGFVRMAPIPGLVTNDFSVVAWMRVVANDLTPQTYLVTLHQAWTPNGFLMLVNESGGLGSSSKAAFVLTDGNHVATSSTVVTDGQWHQVVMVSSKTGLTSVYVDGSPAEASFPTPNVTELSPPFLVGGVHGVNVAGVTDGAYSGLVDDVQIYDHALTDQDVNRLFANPGFNLPQLEQAVLFVPEAGPFVGSVEVRLLSTIPGAVLRYTLNGNDPVLTSPRYEAPFTLRETTTIKTRLFVNEFPVSEVIAATYTKQAPIAFQPVGGLFTNSVEVTIVNHLGLGIVRYTQDATEPVAASPAYTQPIRLDAATTVKARIFINGFPASETLSAEYLRVYAVDDGIPASWREQYFGPNYLTDPRVAADADPDGDGFNNRIEYDHQTVPTNKTSYPPTVLAIRAIPRLEWNTIPGLSYRVLRKPDANATTWTVVLPPFRAADTKASFVDEGAPMTSIYLIEVVP